jgi:DNA polymerase-3 subunit epsilon
MRSHITDIGYDLTGSELVALLKESFDIKKHKPLYNRAQRRTMNHFGIYTYVDGNGYIRFQVGQNSANEDLPVVSFNNSVEAKNYLSLLVEKYKLCQKLCGLYNSSEGCFHYQIRECYGACMGEECPDEYNRRAQQVIHLFEYDSENFWIIDKGRHSEEYSVVRIRNGKYLGFGYIGTDVAISSTEHLSDCIKYYPDNREVQQIIKSYLKNHPAVKIIRD